MLHQPSLSLALFARRKAEGDVGNRTGVILGDVINRTGTVLGDVGLREMLETARALFCEHEYDTHTTTNSRIFKSRI
jgi:hypothetical protein